MKFLEASNFTAVVFPAMTGYRRLAWLVRFIQRALSCTRAPLLAFISGAAFSFLPIGASPVAYAVDPNSVIDFRMDSVNVEGGKADKILVGAKWVRKVTAQEGQTISLSCNWSANLVGAAYWKTKIDQTIQYVIKIDEGTIGIGPSLMPAGTTLGKKETKGGGLNVPSFENPSPVNVSGTSTNYGNAFATKTGSVKWTAKGIGPHTVKCILPETGFQEKDLNNNIAEAWLEVAAVPKLLSQVPGSDTRSGVATIADTDTPVTAAQGAIPNPPAQPQEPRTQSEASGTYVRQDRPIGTPGASASSTNNGADESAWSSPGQFSSPPNSVATDHTCGLRVPYLKAESPVIEIGNPDLRQGDVFRIVCRFTADVKELTWSDCDVDTARMVEGYKQRISSSSAARYSGMVDVNGSTVRVAASPPQGLSDFEIEHLWLQKEPGTISVGCKVDNVLLPFVEGSSRYIESQKSVSVGSRLEGRKTVGRADLPPSGRNAVGSTSIGGSGAVDPTLNRVHEVPAEEPRQGATGRGSGNQPQPPMPTGPSVGVAADLADQQTKSGKNDSLTRIHGGMPLPAETANSGAMNPIVEPVGLPVDCALKGGGLTIAASVTITNTTRQPLEKGATVKWTIYKKGIQLGGLVNTESEGVYYDQGVLNAALAIGEAGKVGVFAPKSLGGYECKASVMPASAGGTLR